MSWIFYAVNAFCFGTLFSAFGDSAPTIKNSIGVAFVVSLTLTAIPLFGASYWIGCAVLVFTFFAFMGTQATLRINILMVLTLIYDAVALFPLQELFWK